MEHNIVHAEGQPSTKRRAPASYRIMRDKELRLALICYGGISLAVYMHGVTKEIWRLTEASRGHHEGHLSSNIYGKLLRLIRDKSSVNLRVLPDIIAGASAGGINGIFLAQALATGQSLEPLTALWLDNADVDQLLDPEARPESNLTKFWATPLAWVALRKPGGMVDQTVSAEGRDEVREKLTRFVRARWFEPPFGGPVFTAMLLSAFDAMTSQPGIGRLLPPEQPLDLFVSVTDFNGSPARLKLNSPPESYENEHRLTISFRQDQASAPFADAAELVFAARATASFPGAFPPFSVKELDGVLKSSGTTWPGRDAFLARTLPMHKRPEDAVLIDGSVLANAPFQPAIDALKSRPARREVDRRFVYIDPKPGQRAVSFTKNGENELPGFISTIFGAISDLPREQPIRDSLEAIDGRSSRIRRLQRIVEALNPSVEQAIERLFGRTFFLDSPTAARMKAWRNKAQTSAAKEAGFAFVGYAHMKLSGIVEELAGIAARQEPAFTGEAFEALRQSIWAEVRRIGADQPWLANGKGTSPQAIAFFRAHDLGFRIRRIRFVLRTLSRLIDEERIEEAAVTPLRNVLFELQSGYFERSHVSFFRQLDRSNAKALLADIAEQRGLSELDARIDGRLAEAYAVCPKTERRSVLYAYLGFPYFDISTLPMLQGEGHDEFDPIKVDRISPEDATSIRKGVKATLKGIEFNAFGAFFSRAYRENDYLWGRLHGADRMFDIICSSIPGASVQDDADYRRLKRELLLAILDEEEGRLTRIPGLFGTLRSELAAGPLGDPSR